MTTNRLLVSISSFLSIAALTAIVSLAIGTDRLGDLIGGVVALGVIMVGLAAVGVVLYAKMSASRAERERLRYEFIQAMAAKGALPNDGNWIPLHAMIDAPADVPVSLQGITNDQLAEFRIHAVNLLALSKQEMGENSGQVIPFYRARENDYFRDVAIWTNAVRFLIANNMAVERYKGNKKIGTYLNAGTVGQAFANLNRP